MGAFPLSCYPNHLQKYLLPADTDYVAY